MSNKNIQSFVGIFVSVVVSIFLALAGGDGGVKLNGLPVFWIMVGLSFVIQWLVFFPSYFFRTEKYYDLTGTSTYLALVWSAFILASPKDKRSILLVTLITIWTVRLGFFLFRRILRTGEDKRFKELKQSFMRFWLTWTLQGLWVVFTAAAALAALTSPISEPLGMFGYFGLGLWIVGFMIEAIADWQKSKFRSDPSNSGKFISSGLWAWSRHPNYFGEIVLWIGIALIALPTMEGLRYVTLVSPLFVIFLLTKVSGIPLLEKIADERWGGQEDYETYKTKTPVIVPRPPKK